MRKSIAIIGEGETEWFYFDSLRVACMEPVQQLSWSDRFKYVSPRDTEVRYSYYGLGQGTHSIETEYYLDRPGTYEIGVATIVCTYAPEYRAICKSQKITVEK